MARTTTSTALRLLSVALITVLVLLSGCSSDEALTSNDPATPGPSLATAGTCGYSQEEEAMIEEYVEAWNARDVDAIMGLLSPATAAPDGEPYSRDSIRCHYEVALQLGLDLHLDFDECVGWFTDADGNSVAAGDGELCRVYCEFSFDLAEDRLLEASAPMSMTLTDVLDSDAYWACLPE